MGFFSHRRRDIRVNPEQKWDYISLSDFKSTSCFTPFAYGYLWFSLIISLAVYAVDVFTAYQLLAFNKWSSQIEPAQFIPFDVSKYIFSGCIILSFVNLGYEYFRAITIMRRGAVAECFLDSLAARLESTRMGSGRGWRRFLVFAELTKSKKGAEYIALFTFFSFQSWIRTILCAGPRQVINGLTLYSVYNTQLQINEANFESSLASFFDKIRALATEEPQQAVILSGMCFTLVIWVFSFLSLLLAAVFFVFFLWSYIPREDGGLTGFCERKINKRLMQIVQKKINKALAEEERKRKKTELKAAKKNGEDRPMTMKPSLPVLNDDGLPAMPSLNRADTFATFDEKPSRPSTPGSFEMNALGRKPPMRSDTKLTTTSQYSSNASLLNGAADMGMAPSDSTVPTLPPLDLGGYPPARTATSATNRSYGQPPLRTGTTASNRSYGQPPPLGRDGYPPLRSATSSSTMNYSQPPSLQRFPSNGSTLRGEYSASPAPYSSDAMPSLPARVMSPYDNNSNDRGPPRDRFGYPEPTLPMLDEQSGRASPAPYSSEPTLPARVMSPFDNNANNNNRGPPRDRHAYPEPTIPMLEDQSGRASPAPTYRSNPMSPRGPGPATGPGGYPIRSATGPVPPRTGGPPQHFPPPVRAMTQPMGGPMHQQRGSNASARSQGMGPGMGMGPGGMRHQQSASNSSLRNLVAASASPAPSSVYEDQGSEVGYGNGNGRGNVGGQGMGMGGGNGGMGGQRGQGPPRGGNGNGWGDDLERGTRF